MPGSHLVVIGASRLAMLLAQVNAALGNDSLDMAVAHIGSSGGVGPARPNRCPSRLVSGPVDRLRGPLADLGSLFDLPIFRRPRWRRLLAQTGYEVGFGQLLVARLSSEAVGQSVPSGTVLSDAVSLHLLTTRGHVSPGAGIAGGILLGAATHRVLRARVLRDAALEAATRVRPLLPGAGG
jgi:hypothetical protein